MKILISSILLMLLFLSGCSDDSSAPPAPKTVTVDIAPVTVTLDEGTSEELRAIATDENGESTDVTDQATWAVVGTDGVIELDATDPSLVKALAVGEDSVTATFGGITSVKPTVVTVVQETLVSLAVTPANATMLVTTTQDFKAVGTYNTERTQDLTKESSWESLNPVFVTMVANEATAVSPIASASIEASHDGITSPPAIVEVFDVIDRLEMTPEITQLFDGELKTFIALAYFTGTTEPDFVTDQAVWSSNNLEVIVPDSSGGGTKSTFKAISPGTATITATHENGASDSVSVSQIITVDAVFLDRIEIRPPQASITAGNTREYDVVAIYTDGDSTNINGHPNLEMSVSDAEKAYIERSINKKWVLTAKAAGNVRITANLLEPGDGTNLPQEHHDHAELTITDPAL